MYLLFFLFIKFNYELDADFNIHSLSFSTLFSTGPDHLL